MFGLLLNALITLIFVLYLDKNWKIDNYKNNKMN